MRLALVSVGGLQYLAVARSWTGAVSPLHRNIPNVPQRVVVASERCMLEALLLNLCMTVM
jgi:hypothetical protein